MCYHVIFLVRRGMNFEINQNSAKKWLSEDVVPVVVLMQCWKDAQYELRFENDFIFLLLQAIQRLCREEKVLILCIRIYFTCFTGTTSGGTSGEGQDAMRRSGKGTIHHKVRVHGFFSSFFYFSSTLCSVNQTISGFCKTYWYTLPSPVNSTIINHNMCIDPCVISHRISLRIPQGPKI